MEYTIILLLTVIIRELTDLNDIYIMQLELNVNL